MKNRYQKFLESFIDEFSETNSINAVTQRTDDLFSAVIEGQSAQILEKVLEKNNFVNLSEINKVINPVIGDTVQQFDPSTWGDNINFNDEHLGQVVRHKKTKRVGVVIRSDESVFKDDGDDAKFKTSGKKVPAARVKSTGADGWERGPEDPTLDTPIVMAKNLEGHGPFGDVKVAILRNGKLNPKGKLQFWYAQEYEATGEQVDVPDLIATAKVTDKEHRRAASWKYKNRKAMPAISYKRGEDGSWELANPEDFDEETRAELIAKMDNLPDDISADEIERWRKREEAEQSAEAANLYLDRDRYDNIDDYLNPMPTRRR